MSMERNARSTGFAYSYGKHALTALLVVLFGYFIWPTPYEYTRKAPDVYRVNRFTGVREFSTPLGWQTGQEAEPSGSSQKLTELDAVELGQLSIDFRIQSYGWVKADVYNGLEFEVTGLVLRVVGTSSEGQEVLNRKYDVSIYSVTPLTSKEVLADLGFQPDPEVKYTVSIESAKRKG